MIWGGGSLFEFWALLLFLTYVTGFLTILSGLRWAFRHWQQHPKMKKSKHRFSALLLATLVLSGSYRLAAAPLIHVQQIHNYGRSLVGDRFNPKLWPDVSNELYCGGKGAYIARGGLTYPLQPGGGFTNGFPNHGYEVAEETALKLENDGWLVLRRFDSLEVNPNNVDNGFVDATVMQPEEAISHSSLILSAIRGGDERLVYQFGPEYAAGSGVRRVDYAIGIGIRAWPGNCTDKGVDFYRPDLQAEGVETFTP